MSYELEGKIKTIMDQKTFGSGFTIREFVVTVEDGKYPQDIILQFVQDKVSLLDTIDEGQDVTVNFDIRGREYGNKYFNTLQAWKIEADSVGANDAQAYDGAVANMQDGSKDNEGLYDYEDDVPF